MVFVFSPYIRKFTSCFQFQVNLKFYSTEHVQGNLCAKYYTNLQLIVLIIKKMILCILSMLFFFFLFFFFLSLNSHNSITIVPIPLPLYVIAHAGSREEDPSGNLCVQKPVKSLRCLRPATSRYRTRSSCGSNLCSF